MTPTQQKGPIDRYELKHAGLFVPRDYSIFKKYSIVVRFAGRRACAHRREWRRAGAMALRSIRGQSHAEQNKTG